MWNRERAESFKDGDTVRAYRFRVPYPDETFKILSKLISGKPRIVLDAGCGNGAIARNLVELVDRVDAVDFSLPMIEEAKRLPNGDNPRIHWIHDKIEDATLDPPYSLIIAGMSLHWMDWDVVAPRFQKMLTTNGHIAVVYNVFSPPPWDEELKKLRSRYSQTKSTGFKPPQIVDELEKQGKFAKCGVKETAPIIYTQSIDAYVEQFHSRSDMARSRIGKEAADRFDNELRALVSGYVKGETIEIELHARVTWGLPRC